MTKDDFSTEFGRRAFSAMAEIYAENGSFDIGAAAGVLTPDEISRITKLAVGRSRLDNGEDVFDANVAALRAEKSRQLAKGEDAFDAIRRLREKNKGNT